MLSLFAVTAPGLAPIAARELEALGIARAAPEAGGVAFEGTLEDVYRANLWLRTANRVLARVDEFEATAFYQLEKIARHLPWERYLSPGQPVALRVTCRKSRLYHSDAVAERVAGAIEARLGRGGGYSSAAADDADEDAQAAAPLVVVRLLHDRCTLSVDTSGALLHLRGYRQATAKAPLRETLAAAMLIAAGYAAPGSGASNGSGAFLDPMSGAGTLPIEAAWLARNVAPGLQRSFAFMRWPGFDARVWHRLVDEARGRQLAHAPGPIQASDRDAGAVAAAGANAQRAGVAGDIEFAQRTLSAVQPPPGPGCLVTNPPYGLRVGEHDSLPNLYAQLGSVARRKCPGWRLALIAADDALLKRVGIPLEAVFSTSNGGIAVHFVRGDVPEA